MGSLNPEPMNQEMDDSGYVQDDTSPKPKITDEANPGNTTALKSVNLENRESTNVKTADIEMAEDTAVRTADQNKPCENTADGTTTDAIIADREKNEKTDNGDSTETGTAEQNSADGQTADMVDDEVTGHESDYKGAAQMLDLSDDVLLYILQYCSPQDLKALGFTCPRLGSLVLDRTLWVDVDCGEEPFGRRRVRWLLARALGPHTRRLRLSGYAREAEGCVGFVNRYDMPDAGPSGANVATPTSPPEEERYLCGGPRVYRLTQSLPRQGGVFPYYWPTPSQDPAPSDPGSCPGPQLTLTHTALRSLTATCTQLTSLELDYVVIDCHTTNIGMFPKTLTKLSLRGSKCFNQETKSFLFKIQDHLTNLEELDVSHCDWIEPACMLPLSKMASLRALRMRECHKLAEFVAYASLATRYGFKKLKYLDLRGSPVGDSEVSALGWLPDLEELYLSPSPCRRVREHAHTEKPPAHIELHDWEHPEPDYFKPPLISEDEWLRDEQNVRGAGNRTSYYNSDDPSACILLERMIAEPVAPEEYSQVYHQFLAGHNSNIPLANPEEYREAYRQYMARPHHAHPPAGYSLFIRKPEDERTGAARRDDEPGTSKDDKTSNETGMTSNNEESGTSKDEEAGTSNDNPGTSEDNHDSSNNEGDAKLENVKPSSSKVQPETTDFKIENAKSTKEMFIDENKDMIDDKYNPGTLNESETSNYEPNSSNDICSSSESEEKLMTSKDGRVGTSKDDDLKSGMSNDINTPCRNQEMPMDCSKHRCSAESSEETSKNDSLAKDSKNISKDGSDSTKKRKMSSSQSSDDDDSNERASNRKRKCDSSDKKGSPKSDGVASQNQPKSCKKRKNLDKSDENKSDEPSTSGVKHASQQTDTDSDSDSKCSCDDCKDGEKKKKAKQPRRVYEITINEITSQPRRDPLPPPTRLARQRLFQFRQYRRPIVIEEYINVYNNNDCNGCAPEPERQDEPPLNNRLRPDWRRVQVCRERSLFSHAPRLDHSALVSDSSIRRFGRADGENINYIHIGPRGPVPAPVFDPHARPNRSNLRVLSVTGFRHVTNVSLTHLTTAAPFLRRLDLSGTAVTAGAVEQFKIVRPECEVVLEQPENLH